MFDIVMPDHHSTECPRSGHASLTQIQQPAGQVDEVRLCIRQYRFQAVVSYVNEISRPGLQDHHSDLQALYTDLYHDKSFARSFASNAADALQSDSRQRTKLEKEINKARLIIHAVADVHHNAFSHTLLK
eukprot:1145291-Pelagomonas_calceolata.AAC.2